MVLFCDIFPLYMSSKVRKAVIPVAGLGTRFLPVTKAIPKEMLPVVDKPVLQYLVEEAVASGIETIVFVIKQKRRVAKPPRSPRQIALSRVSRLRL